MQIPRFPECYHPLIDALMGHSDQELLEQLQQQPESGRFFVALFCRYSPLVYSLVQHSTQSQPDVEYRFAQAWRRVYADLQDLDLDDFKQPADAGHGSGDDTSSTHTSSTHTSSTIADDITREVQAPLTLQNWIINATASVIHGYDPTATENLRYSLTFAPPPLWCYLERSLDQLSPIHRLIVVLHRTFGWPLDEVATYLRSTGTDVDGGAVVALLEEALHQIDAALPTDIHDIYLSQRDDVRST